MPPKVRDAGALQSTVKRSAPNFPMLSLVSKNDILGLRLAFLLQLLKACSKIGRQRYSSAGVAYFRKVYAPRFPLYQARYFSIATSKVTSSIVSVSTTHSRPFQRLPFTGIFPSATPVIALRARSPATVREIFPSYLRYRSPLKTNPRFRTISELLKEGRVEA